VYDVVVVVVEHQYRGRIRSLRLAITTIVVKRCVVLVIVDVVFIYTVVLVVVVVVVPRSSSSTIIDVAPCASIAIVVVIPHGEDPAVLPQHVGIELIERRRRSGECRREYLVIGRTT
jgi:hypothetical protein